MTGPFGKHVHKPYNSVNIRNNMSNDSTLFKLVEKISLDSASFAEPALIEKTSSDQLENSRIMAPERSEHESDSGCVLNGSESGFVNSSQLLESVNLSDSGHVAAVSLGDVLSDYQKTIKSLRLVLDSVQRIINRRTAVLQVVSDGRASADLFFVVDEDSDSYVL